MVMQYQPLPSFDEIELPPSEPSTEERRAAVDRLLRTYVETGDTTARRRLIELHLPLVRSLARRYRVGGAESDDLEQAGSVGLINAIDRFDPRRGADLAAFAVPNIEGEIKRHLRDKEPALRLPRRLQELQARIPRARAELEARNGRAPDATELAELLDVGRSEVELALALAPPARSSSPGGESEGPDAHEVEALGERMMLADAFHTLDEQERRILYLRFVRDVSRAEAARQLGLSERTLSRQTERALTKLRDELDSERAAAEGAASRPSAVAPAEAAPARATPAAVGTAQPAEQSRAPGYHITIAASEGPGAGWTARVEELPDCRAEGTTAAEAAERVEVAMQDWIARAVAEKRKIPEPRGPSRHSGKLMLRMPQSLHAELAHAAERDEVSLNQFITGTLASAVGWRRAGEEPTARGGRLLPVAIAANTVVVVIAVLVALVLLVLALREGL